MGGRIAKRLPSPGLAVAGLALVAALAGTALAERGASTSTVGTKQVKKIAKKQIVKLAPKLSVGNAARLDGLAPGQIVTARSAREAGTNPCATALALTYADCVSTNVDVAKPSRLLVIASATWEVSGGGLHTGDCLLEVDDNGAFLSPRALVADGDTGQAPTIALNGVSGVMAPGAHHVDMTCRLGVGAVRVREADLTVAVVGSA